MGLHGDIKKHVIAAFPSAVVDDSVSHEELERASLCVIDFMWLMFRFRGVSGKQLVFFFLRQALEAFESGAHRAAVITDDPRKVPTQKMKEQAKRSSTKRKAIADIAVEDLRIDDDHVPNDFVAAVAHRDFRARLMCYLETRVFDALESAEFRELTRRAIDRREPRDRNVVLCLRVGTGRTTLLKWSDTEGWVIRDGSPELGQGEADMAAVEVIRHFAKEDASLGIPTGNVFVRTIDSDSIPILSMLHLRLPDVRLFLWLPACGVHARSENGARDRVSIASIARRVGVLRESPHVSKRPVVGPWGREKRLLICINEMHANYESVLRFVLLCVIMGTDFNVKLVRRVGLIDLQAKVGNVSANSVSACFDEVDAFKRVCHCITEKTKSKISASGLVDDEEFSRAWWVLRYWSERTTEDRHTL
ncbi:hypothetical protein CYMTET_35682 [Cymbomonas tetramitiformis]|uniref:Uncharacterized protein n=1 Tax=Cymbomonas tetramitiformis TaxID=36881 RepID=A0AAE0F8Y7_9CHLO|nr:hypothetical protein CYMTET_35682 [Cymbomonas tetramitiformis]|eukprot:gene293-548_t